MNTALKESPSNPSRRSAARPKSALNSIGIIGMDPVEPAILGALIGREPLLLMLTVVWFFATEGG